MAIAALWPDAILEELFRSKAQKNQAGADHPPLSLHNPVSSTQQPSPVRNLSPSSPAHLETQQSSRALAVKCSNTTLYRCDPEKNIGVMAIIALVAGGKIIRKEMCEGGEGCENVNAPDGIPALLGAGELAHILVYEKSFLLGVYKEKWRMKEEPLKLPGAVQEVFRGVVLLVLDHKDGVKCFTAVNVSVGRGHCCLKA
ncbi:Mycbp-Associated Protein [Manis pentadactyla]|nr:Mycbp-Associated Protein [Manis pentadactyla]